MRAAILEALRRRDAAPPPAPVKAIAAAAAPAPKRAEGAEDEPQAGKYDPSYIRQVIREDLFPMVRKCYESALVRAPKLGGRLVMTFKIVGDPSVGGVVEDADFGAESTLKDEEMATCVRESLMTVTFDKPPSGGGFVTVKYPIAFSPDDEEAGDAGSR
jgi:hypothetical protein